MTFKYRMKQLVRYKDIEEPYWIVERMWQEVLNPETDTYWINELYLIVPKGKDYKAFGEILKGGPPCDYVSVENIILWNQ